MNLGEMKTLVASWLDDANYGYFTEPQLLVWLNNGTRTTAKRLIKAGQNDYTKCVVTTCVIGQKDYVLPLDFKKERRLEIVVTGYGTANESLNPLSNITINQQDYITTGLAMPCAFYFKRNRVVISPAPDSTYYMRLFYDYEISDMANDTDTPDLPVAYHELACLHAAQDGFLKDGRVNDLIDKKIAEYQKDLDRDAQERSLSAARSVVMTQNSGGSGFFF